MIAPVGNHRGDKQYTNEQARKQAKDNTGRGRPEQSSAELRMDRALDRPSARLVPERGLEQARTRATEKRGPEPVLVQIPTQL